MQNLLTTATQFLKKGDERTVNAKKNIFALLFLKGINILTGFLIVPITIDYVSPETYGIWLTLSAVIIWISYFDLGLPSGFRNKFAEAKALGKDKLAKIYVSTTYAVITLLFTAILLILLFLNQFADWSSIFNISPSYKQELHMAFSILSIFICIRIVISVFTYMLLADQKPALSAAVLTLGQLAALLTIYIFTKTIPASIYYLAVATAGIPCGVIALMSVIVFCSPRYRKYAPSPQYVRFSMTRQLLGLGIQFSVITISGLVILQLINVAISKELGSLYVTQYNIAYKYFSIVFMMAELIVSPFWSAFTEAYVLNDKKWMYKSFHTLEKVILLCIPIIIIMYFLTPTIIQLWVGNMVSVPASLSAAMGVFVFFQSAYCIYSNMVYGIGRIRIQLIIFLLFAFSAFFFISIGIERFGLWGCMIFPTFAYFILAFVCRLQIKMILTQKDCEI